MLSRGKQKDASQAESTATPPSRNRPTARDLERIDAFLGDFLLPMLADGQISTEDETPLVVAFHAYGIDAFDSWHVLGRAFDRIQFGVPGHSRSFAKAWARIQLHVDRMTRNDFLRTREWLEAEARRAGLENFQLSDADPGTQFSTESIDSTCVGRFTKLVETMKASNLPVAPFSVQPEVAGDGLLLQSEESADADADAAFGAGGAASEAVDDLDDGPQAVSSPGTAPISARGVVEPTQPQVIEVHVPEEIEETVQFRAEQLRESAADILAAFEAVCGSKGDRLPGLLFDDSRSGTANQVVVIESLPDDQADLWFLGDLHGDLLALESALEYIDQQWLAQRESDGQTTGEGPRIVLLGDLFDDGDHSYEVILRILQLAVQRAGRIALLAGNHDEALAFDHETGMFRSSVSPSDFTDWLNARIEDPTVRGVGLAVIELFARVPRALLFPDGLIAAHGGIPLSDLWSTFSSLSDLEQPQCLQDFVWTRAHLRAKHKIPNRMTRGCEFGYQDLEGFCAAASAALDGRPVRRLLRGHDHVEQRYQFYPKYQRSPVLTINAMSRRLPREVFGEYVRVPCVAKYRAGHLPEVHRLLIREETVRLVYPEPIDPPAEPVEVVDVVDGETPGGTIEEESAETGRT